MAQPISREDIAQIYEAIGEPDRAELYRDIELLNNPLGERTR